MHEWQECLQNTTATVMPERSGELSRFETSVAQGFNICYYRLGVNLTTLSAGESVKVRKNRLSCSAKRNICILSL